MILAELTPDFWRGVGTVLALLGGGILAFGLGGILLWLFWGMIRDDPWAGAVVFTFVAALACLIVGLVMVN